MVNGIYKANTHSAADTVGGRASEQAQFCLPHGNERTFYKERNAHSLSKLGKSVQAIKQDAKCKGTP